MEDNHSFPCRKRSPTFQTDPNFISPWRVRQRCFHKDLPTQRHETHVWTSENIIKHHSGWFIRYHWYHHKAESFTFCTNLRCLRMIPTTNTLFQWYNPTWGHYFPWNHRCLSTLKPLVNIEKATWKMAHRNSWFTVPIKDGDFPVR